MVMPDCIDISNSCNMTFAVHYLQEYEQPKHALSFQGDPLS